MMSTEKKYRQPAYCKIIVNKEEIKELYPYLVDVKVEISRAAASTCTMTFETFRLPDCSWFIQDKGTFKPWYDFTLSADFGMYEEEIMRGFVKTISSSTPEKMGEAKVTVTCQDETILLDRNHIRKNWSNEASPLCDGKIAQQIAGQYNLKAKTEDGLQNISLNQDSTDITFLRKRAEANGFELYIRGGELFFLPSQLDDDPLPSILIYAGKRTNCNSFTVNNDGHKPDQVGLMRAAETGTVMENEIYEPDLKLLGKEAATSKNSGLVSFSWNIPRPAGSSYEETISRAKAKANENAWKISAEGELDGSLYGHVLLTHKVVGVYGLGNTDSGLYYVDSVTHSFDRNGYRQSFKLLRNATGKNTEPEPEDSLASARN